jgi:hypothetical protein
MGEDLQFLKNAASKHEVDLIRAVSSASSRTSLSYSPTSSKVEKRQIKLKIISVRTNAKKLYCIVPIYLIKIIN